MFLEEMYIIWKKKIYILHQSIIQPDRSPRLNARVGLGVKGARVVVVPVLALAVELAGVAFDLADPVRLLQELDGEALVGVPRDVAVHHWNQR